MSIQIIGKSGTVADVDGSTYRPLKVTARQVEYGFLGSYRIGIRYVLVSTNPGNNFLCFRWADLTNIGLLWGVNLTIGLEGDGSGSSQSGYLQMYLVRSMTSAGVLPTQLAPLNAPPSTQALKSSMACSQMASIQYGVIVSDITGIYDANPIAQAIFPNQTTRNSILVESKQLLYGSLEKQSVHPIVLVANEGFSLVANLTAGSTYTIGVEVAWSEVSSY
jgi:hypothetical protein